MHTVTQQNNKFKKTMNSKFLIYKAFNNLQNIRPEWLAAIEKRPTGSQWLGEKIHWQVLANLDWQFVPFCQQYKGIFNENCLYYRLDSHVPIGMENIRFLSDFNGDFSSIELHEGAHGKELISSKVQPTSTTEAWLIVGNVTTEPIIYTAYPGRIAASIAAVDMWDGSLSQTGLEMLVLSGKPIAVKGV